MSMINSRNYYINYYINIDILIIPIKAKVIQQRFKSDTLNLRV